MLRRIFFLAIILLIIFTGIKVNNSGQGKKVTGKANQPSNSATQKTFDKSKYSTSDSASLWVIVNKQHQLSPKDYVPKDLTFPKISLRNPGDDTMKQRNDSSAALEAMFGAAKKDGINLLLVSGYRSYYNQSALYNSYVKASGQAVTDRQSARAGYSEHQTGLAADLGASNRKCEIEQCFANTAEGKWLAANAYKFGFLIRYPLDKEDITGYEYEPWHVRFVGTNLSTEMNRLNITTLEEYFNISGGKNYG